MDTERKKLAALLVEIGKQVQPHIIQPYANASFGKFAQFIEQMAEDEPCPWIQSLWDRMSWHFDCYYNPRTKKLTAYSDRGITQKLLQETFQQMALCFPKELQISKKEKRD